MSNSSDYVGIDYFRIIAAILVIAIHTSPLLSYTGTGDLLLAGILARVAVPFFFMVTGFFLFPRDQEKAFSFPSFLRKNAKLYGIAILLYLPLSIYAGYFNQTPFLPELLKDIAVNGTFYHLWYFPAVILGVAAVVLLLRRLPFKTAFITTCLLYLAGLFGDSYYGLSAQIPLLKGVYYILFQCFDYTRNGLFFTPLYLMLGIRLSKNEPLSRKHCITGLIISLSLMTAEGLILHLWSQPRHDSMYLFLPFSMYFLFQLLTLHRGTAAKGLREISLLIYLIHPWCIVLVRGFAKAIGAETVLIQNSVIFFLAVSGLSICLSVGLFLLWEKQKARLYFLIGNQSGYFNTGKRAGTKKERPDPLAKGRAWAEISRSNLRYNLISLEQILPEDCRVMAVVKADAYGHGAVPVASELQAFGVNAFAVATIQEGILLRKNGIKGTILILGYTHPSQIKHLLKYRLVQTVVDYSHGLALNRSAAHIRKKLPVHLKIDTGMHRLGENYENSNEIAAVFRMPNLTIEGVFTHLCAADSVLEEDIRFTRLQLECFYRAVDLIGGLGYPLPQLHVQSSYGILNYPELHCSCARIGIAIYGALSQAKDKTKVQVVLKPVMSIRARISIVKELAENQTVGYGRQFKADKPIRIAVVAIGYADGIPRNLKNGRVLISGRFAPIIGRICMDQLTVDITGIPEVKQGDIATLLGQDGQESILPKELAQQAGTITNELFSRLGPRLERIYV